MVNLNERDCILVAWQGHRGDKKYKNSKKHKTTQNIPNKQIKTHNKPYQSKNLPGH